MRSEKLGRIGGQAGIVISEGKGDEERPRAESRCRFCLLGCHGILSSAPFWCRLPDVGHNTSHSLTILIPMLGLTCSTVRGGQISVAGHVFVGGDPIAAGLRSFL